MMLNLCLITPNRIVWNSEVQEVILSTNSGQIGILPNHAPLLTALDIGVMKVRVNEQWSNMALMGGFATIENNNINVLVNEAEVAIDINPEEARNTFFQNKTNLARAKGKKEAIEADLALKRSKARLEALN